MKVTSNLWGLSKQIKNDMAKAGADFRRAVQLGTKQAGSGLKMALRQQVRTANLGTRMEKTWQDEVFPKSGNSANAAVIVYSKAPKIIAAFDNGVYIKSKSGTFLAIPTKNAPRRGFDGKQVTPTNWPEHRFGKLRLVKTKRALLLVADNLTASYRRKDKSFRGFRRASDKAIKANRRLATVVMFILVRQISLPKKLDVEREFKKWSAAYPALIERNLERASD